MIIGTEPGLGAALAATRNWDVCLPGPVDRRHLLADPVRGIPCQVCWAEAEKRAKEPGGRGVTFEYLQIISDVNAPCVADLETGFLAELEEARTALVSGCAEPGSGLAADASGGPGSVGRSARPSDSRPNPTGPPALQGGSSTPGRQRVRPGDH